MTLSDTDIAQLESRIGPIGIDPASDQGRLDKAVARLGSPSLAALEVLSIRYSEMVSTPAEVTSTGQGWARHTANMKPMLAMIMSLRAEIIGNSDVSPTDEGEALLNQAGALGAPAGGIESFDVTASNRRQG